MQAAGAGSILVLYRNLGPRGNARREFGKKARESNPALPDAKDFPQDKPRERTPPSHEGNALAAHSGSAGRFLTGPDFLPAPGTLAGLENLLAQADGSGGNFDEFVVGNKLDGLLEAQLAVRD